MHFWHQIELQMFGVSLPPPAQLNGMPSLPFRLPRPGQCTLRFDTKDDLNCPIAIHPCRRKLPIFGCGPFRELNVVFRGSQTPDGLTQWITGQPPKFCVAGSELGLLPLGLARRMNSPGPLLAPEA